MEQESVSRRTNILFDAVSPLIQFFDESQWAERLKDPNACDFTLGNPHEVALPAYTGALQQQLIPRDESWYGYKRNEPGPRAIVADSLSKSHSLPFVPEDIFLTNGAIAALSVVINTITDPDDEIIFHLPPWPLYEGLIRNAGGIPVKLPLLPRTHDLDLEGIRQAVGPRTKAVIINSPHNPTGRIYQPKDLAALAHQLAKAGKQYGRTIYLISDEAYRKILFDDHEYHSPVTFYPESFLVYTYGKALLAPGQRIGYLALHPEMTGRFRMRAVIPAIQMVNGWAFPNALLLHSLADLDRISVDMTRLEARRNVLVENLRMAGYETNLPEGTFYVLVKSPWPDDRAFVNLLARYKVFCMPGSLLEIPGYFRISLTASDAMVQRAIPGFKAALQLAMESANSPGGPAK